MLPLIARASQEVLLLVPDSLREAADALGVSRWRTVIGVVLPAAMGGIITGTRARRRARRRRNRAADPRLLASTGNHALDPFGEAVAEYPGVDLHSSRSPPTRPASTRAWGAALVLLVFILIANIAARAACLPQPRKLGQ